MRCGWEAALGALAVLAVTTAGPVTGQEAWEPDSRVEMIVNVDAGGGTDRIARVVQAQLEKGGFVEVPITVVNRGGAGGALGITAVADAEPDGTTIGFSNNNLLSTPMVQRGVPSYEDLTALAILSRNYVGFAVKADSAIETPQDIVDALKEDPTKLSFAIGNSVGNQNHIALALVADSIGVNPAELRAVVLDSGGDTATSVLGGHIDVGLTSVQNFLPHVESGGMRLVAVSAPERLSGLEDVPVWTEHDINSVAGNWYAVFGPAGMEEAQVQFWNGAFARLTESEGWQKYLSDNMVADAYRDSDAAREHFREESASLRRILTNLGVVE